MSETYYSGENTRQMYGMGAAEGIASSNILKAQFPHYRDSDYFSISTPAFHEVLNEQVITCCLPWAVTETIMGPDYTLLNRKFCLGSSTSFIRAYKVFADQKPAWLPASAKVLFVGENHAEFNRPYPPLADTFQDIYLSGDPAEMEAAFGLPERRGTYETYYGITVVNGQPTRVKQYCYDSQGGFSDWDVVWLMNCKRLGRTDLLGV